MYGDRELIKKGYNAMTIISEEGRKKRKK